MYHKRIVTIDLHGMTKNEAKARLLQLLKSSPKDVAEIEIIHGYHSGQALQRLVRQEFKHPRIAQKSFGLNGGSTTYILK